MLPSYIFIVLLILAGVTIATLTGENGIITRAEEAKKETGIKGLKEEIRLAITNKNIEEQVNGNGNLEEELNKIDEAVVSKVVEDTYYVEKNGNICTVYEDGTIEEGKVDIWDGQTIEKPETDEQGNWHIYTTGQMKFFANYCNNVLTEEEKAEANMPEITETTIVYLENNIDMGARQKDEVLTTAAETQWTPVDNFDGIFEGNNHTVTGIYVYDEGYGGGIFTSANVRNITIKNSYIEAAGKFAALAGGIVGTANEIINCNNINTLVKSNEEATISSSGGIAGAANNNTASIKNCMNSGKVIGGNYVGGIIGGNPFGGDFSVSGNINKGEINGLKYVGGIAGILGENRTLSNCYNTGKVVGSDRQVGGIAGLVSSSASVRDSYNNGEIIGKGDRIGGIVGELGVSSTLTNSYNTGKVTGEANNVGGIAGLIFGTIENSYNTGTIQGEGQVGGITGQIGTDCEAYIRNCYNEGSIIGNNDAIGGIVGWTSDTGTSGTIENNYNKGKVTGVDQVGGLIGKNAATFIVTKCYNKGTVEGTTNVGSIIGTQITSNDNLSKLYYLNTLNIGAINGQDVTDKNIIGVTEDINNYENFLTWISSK